MIAAELLARRRAGRPDPGSMTLVEHLGELRSRLLKAVLALAVGAVAGFVLYDTALDGLVQPYCDLKRASDAAADCRLLVTDPLESFSIRLKLGGYLGLLLASPVIFWQLWRFVTPGLEDRERRYAVPFVASSISLFVAGAYLALWTFPKTLDFFAAIGGDQLELFYTPSKYLGLLTIMMLIFGLSFEFPVLLVFLQLAGVVRPERLVRWRRYAIIAIFVFGAVITPSGDPVTLLAMAIPMYGFYEAAIVIGRAIGRRAPSSPDDDLADSSV